METIEELLAWTTEMLGNHIYEGIFLVALIETVVPPIPTLAVFPTAGFLASQAGITPAGLVPLMLLGAAGSTLGATAIYAVSRRVSRATIIKYLDKFRISEKKLERVEAWFEKHGDKAVFACRMMPVMREMISIPAGLLRMRPAKFVLYTYTGSVGWAFITILAGYYFGEAIGIVIGASSPGA